MHRNTGLVVRTTHCLLTSRVHCIVGTCSFRLSTGGRIPVEPIPVAKYRRSSVLFENSICSKSTYSEGFLSFRRKRSIQPKNFSYLLRTGCRTWRRWRWRARLGARSPSQQNVLGGENLNFATSAEKRKWGVSEPIQKYSPLIHTSPCRHSKACGCEFFVSDCVIHP